MCVMIRFFRADVEKIGTVTLQLGVYDGAEQS